MRGDDARVASAFRAWLKQQHWAVSRETEVCDVVATRGGERLFAEAMGRSEAVDVAVDTAYGQLLRRLPLDDTSATLALVVPSEAIGAALRVPRRIRDMLRLRLYVVDVNGRVTLFED